MVRLLVTYMEQTSRPAGGRAAPRPGARIAMLHLDGAQVGLCESCAHADGEIEIMHYGVVPEIQGQGLGSFLLDRALAALWELGPRRIWLHTDTNDHPRAVAAYERAGFRTWLRQWQDFPD